MLLSKHVWTPSEPKAEFHKRKLEAVKWCADVFLPCAFPNLKEFFISPDLSFTEFHLCCIVCFTLRRYAEFCRMNTTSCWEIRREIISFLFPGAVAENL